MYYDVTVHIFSKLAAVAVTICHRNLNNTFGNSKISSYYY